MSVDDAYRRRDAAFNAMTEANKEAVNVRAASKERQEVMYSNGTDVQYRTFKRSNKGKKKKKLNINMLLKMLKEFIKLKV